MGLQVWLPLINGIENQGLNGAIAPQLMGSGVTFTNGKIGQAATFPNSCASCIYMDGLKLQTGSWCAWIKVLGEGSGTSQRIISEGRDTGSIGTNIWLTKAGTTLIFHTHKKQLQTTIELNTWYHVAAIFGNGSIKLYINGSQVGSTTYTDTDDSDYAQSNDKLVLGKMSYSYTNTSNYFPFNGQINDFRVYDHVLSAREVKEISKGLVLHYPLSRGGFGQDNLITNSAQQRDCTYPESGVRDFYAPTTVSVPSGTQYTLSFYAKSTVNGDHMRTHYYSPNTTTTCVSSQGVTKSANDGNMDFTLSTEWKRYWVVYTQTETTAVKHIICPRLCSMASYPSASGTGTVSVKYVKFEEGSVPTPWLPHSSETLYSNLGLNDGIEYDVSGYNHNGIKYGTLTYSSDTPRYNCSSTFNGSNTYIEADPLPSETKTISVWIKSSASGGYKMVFLDKNTRLAIGFSDTRILTYVGSESGTQFQTSGLYVANQWNHLVLIKTGDQTRVLYLNGVEVPVYGTNYWSGDLEKLNIGVRHNSSYSAYFVGQISDFRAYSTVLSASDILELYHTPISLSNNGTLLTQGEYVES